jgi:hypothetical protein
MFRSILKLAYFCNSGFCIFFVAIKHKGHRYITENPGTPFQCTEFSWPFDDFVDALRVEDRFVLAKHSSNCAGDFHLLFCNSNTAKSGPEFSIFVPLMLLIINRAIDDSGQRIPSFVGRCWKIFHCPGGTEDTGKCQLET